MDSRNFTMPLGLFKSDRPAEPTLSGETGRELYYQIMKHTVHRHAAAAMSSSIMVHQIRWKKGAKYADESLTPTWVRSFVDQVVNSILSVGYVIYRVNKSRGTITVATPGRFNLVHKHGTWKIHSPDVTPGWKLIMWALPIDADGKWEHGSATALAATNTAVYDELMENLRLRDHHNSRPTVFTTVDRQLRNVNGSGKQWFQSSTASAAAATRASVVDNNFSYLVNERAETISKLSNATALRRVERESTAEGEVNASASKHHIEHIVSDGNDTKPARSLMSLADGMQFMSLVRYNIFNLYNVPPQIMGININAERSGISPRLNELVITQFIATCQAARQLLQSIFNHIPEAGATLTFRPRLLPHELAEIAPLLVDTVKRDLYADTYHMPASYFRLHPPDTAIPPQSKRKRADVAGGDHLMEEHPQRANRIQARGQREGLR